MKTTAKEIKRDLKEKGFNTKNIRVRVEYIGYGSESITITLKDVSLNRLEIENAVSRSFGNIRYDEHVQGEILEGCNTYVTCKYDYDTLQLAIDEKMEQAQEIYSKLEELNTYSGQDFFENDDIRAIAFFKDKSIALMNKDKENTTRYQSHVLYSPHDLANALVFLENIGHFGTY